MIFRRFDEMKNSFTKSEEKLKDYIVENLDKIKSYNASELANETGISQATIVRFSKKLGYKGFPEMRIALNKEEDSNQGVFHHKINVNDDFYTTNKKIVYLNTNALENTLELVKKADYKRAIELLDKANRIMIFGVGGSYLVVKDFAYKLLKLGKFIYAENDSQIQASNLNSFGKDDLLIAISHSGTSKEVTKLCDLAKKREVPVISITKFAQNPLAKKSDVNLRTSANEETFRISSITSRIAQLTVVDMLYIHLIKENFEKYSNYIGVSKDLVKNYRLK